MGAVPSDCLSVCRTKHPSGIVPQLQNVVATVNLGCPLDLKEIALHARNAEYNPKAGPPLGAGCAGLSCICRLLNTPLLPPAFCGSDHAYSGAQDHSTHLCLWENGGPFRSSS